MAGRRQDAGRLAAAPGTGYTGGTMRRWSGGVAGVMLGGLVAIACGVGGPEVPEERLPEFSAARLGEPQGHPAYYEFLSPAEREALERADFPEMRVARLGDVESDAVPVSEVERGPIRRLLDKIGRAGLAVLVVASSLGMAALPFLI